MKIYYLKTYVDEAAEKEKDKEENIDNNKENKNENSLYDQGLKELGKLDFMTQSNIANIYRHFYNEFLEFSKSFIENDIVITQEVFKYYDLFKKKNF